MKCRIETNYDRDSGNFFKTYSGDVELNDIFSSWEKIIESNSIRKDIKKIVIDYSMANILFPPEEVSEIHGFYTRHDTFFGRSRIGMVMVSPGQIVFPHLIELQKINFTIKAFSTVNAAVHWVQDQSS